MKRCLAPRLGVRVTFPARLRGCTESVRRFGANEPGSLRFDPKEDALMTTRNATKKPVSSGYVSCACRDCMELAIHSPSKKLSYGAACEAAGCPDDQSVPGMSQECRAPGAYGRVRDAMGVGRAKDAGYIMDPMSRTRPSAPTGASRQTER